MLFICAVQRRVCHQLVVPPRRERSRSFPKWVFCSTFKSGTSISGSTAADISISLFIMSSWMYSACLLRLVSSSFFRSRGQSETQHGMTNVHKLVQKLWRAVGDSPTQNFGKHPSNLRGVWGKPIQDWLKQFRIAVVATSCFNSVTHLLKEVGLATQATEQMPVQPDDN